MANITIVLNENTKRAVYTYKAISHPEVGEYIEISGHTPYRVERVIDNGNHDVDVEVRKA